MRRRLMLLGFVVAATALAMAILTPWADKAVQEISLPLRHDDIIRQQAQDKNLDPALIAGVICMSPSAPAGEVRGRKRDSS